MTGKSPLPATGDTGESLAIRFANTCYGDRGSMRDGLATPGQLTAWLQANAGPLAKAGTADVAAARASDADVAVFGRLRDTVRSLIRAAVDGEPLDPAHVAALNELAATAPPWPVLVVSPGVIAVQQRSPGPAGASALGAIARDAVRVLGTARDDVRACQAPGCVQYFVKDHPRRTWCCAACGNRARVARHYQRHKSDD